MMNTITVTTVCPFCGQVQEIKVNPDGYALWRKGGLMRNCLPELDTDQREALISGICHDCRERMSEDAGDPDEPDDDEDYDEPADIDSDFGYNPYMGEYTYDC